MSASEECCEERRKQNLQKIYHYLDGELVESELAEIKDHLRTCSGCESEYGVEAMLKDLVKRSCSENAPAGLRGKIRERIVLETGIATVIATGGAQVTEVRVTQLEAYTTDD